jgi:hypothetical protein
MARKSKTVGRVYVDLKNNKLDHKVALLASMGFTTKYIQKQTGMSAGQVFYRIKKAGLTTDNELSRSDFRNGRGRFARLVIDVAMDQADQTLIEHLNKHL